MVLIGSRVCLRLAQSAPCREYANCMPQRGRTENEESVKPIIRMQHRNKNHDTTKDRECVTLVLALGAILFLGACAKKAAPPPPPPPPSPTAPTASLSANPKYRRSGSTHNPDLADHQRHRRQHRWHRPRGYQRLPAGDPDSTPPPTISSPKALAEHRMPPPASPSTPRPRRRRQPLPTPPKRNSSRKT